MTAERNKRTTVFILLGAAAALAVVLAIVIRNTPESRHKRQSRQEFEQLSAEIQQIQQNLPDFISEAENLLQTTTPEQLYDTDLLGRLTNTLDRANGYETKPVPAAETDIRALDAQIEELQETKAEITGISTRLQNAINDLKHDARQKQDHIKNAEKRAEEERKAAEARELQASYSNCMGTFTFSGEDSMGYSLNGDITLYGPVCGVTEKFPHPANADIKIPANSDERSYLIPYKISIKNTTEGYDQRITFGIGLHYKSVKRCNWAEEKDFDYKLFSFDRNSCPEGTPDAVGLLTDNGFEYRIYTPNAIAKGRYGGYSSSWSWSNPIKPNAVGASYGYLQIFDMLNAPAYPDGIPAEKFPKIIFDFQVKREDSGNYTAIKQIGLQMVEENGKKTFRAE